ncbi:twin-arginine translocase TatA/TatE family subunit [Pseudoblastomonas halimionae]|uniref:Sec-independent protein translocase protein TatA n=1 Tax=Alteriqipengyuania halimionae TaxID=1926630 RepID=A0A6I4U2D2_9SPHN|nr:twin-arginine translocase TatA/TatE family subunit [Alteriqipengyuania halimionae]MXP10170.1 twin-arginine translocase TatA/TatE family subunit [Alteriqipengyuania halimionae]
MSLGPVQLIIIALVILVLFGRGKISEMMGDFGKGVKSFKDGMADEDKPSEPTRQIPPPNAAEGAVPPTPASTEARDAPKDVR